MELPISAQLLSSSSSSSFTSKFPETRVGISKAALLPFLSHRQLLFSPYLRHGLSPIDRHLTALTRASIGESPGSPVTSSPTNTGGRIGETKRTTKDTNMSVDGSGVAESSTGIPFLDQMLDQLASHGLFDVHVKATGDTHIDDHDHYTNEDVALAIGTELPTNPKTLDGEGWTGYAIVNPIDKLQFRCNNVALPCPQETSSLRRHVLARVTVLLTSSFNYGQIPSLAWAGAGTGDEEEKDEGVFGAVKSLFDPNEKTKSGKVLPKAYLKSAREVVKTLRESLKEDPKDVTKFRRTAESAKESIREYLSGWRGQKTVVNEESYVVLEKAIRSLASFYSKAGPSAPLPEGIKSEILNDLKTAEGFL